MDDQLKDLWYNLSTGFTSAIKLYKKARDLKYEVTLKQVKEWLLKQQSHQLTKQVTKPKYYNSITAPAIRDNYQIDLLIYDRYAWHNYKYILCCIDVHSRYVHAVSLTNRKIGTIMDGVKECFKVMGVPKSINSDNEFNTKELNKYMEEEGVTMWSVTQMK